MHRHSTSGMLTPGQIYGLARHCREEDLRMIDEFSFWNKLREHQLKALRQCRKENYVTKEPTWSIWWSLEKRCYLYQPATLEPAMPIVVLLIFITCTAIRMAHWCVSHSITRSLFAGLQRISGKSSKEFLFVYRPCQNAKICSRCKSKY